MWLKLLFLGFDILGLVSAGAMAKAARTEAQPLRAIAKDPTKVSQYLSKNPRLKGFIESMINGAKSVPKKLGEAASWISKKFPAGADFIKSIFSGMTKILTQLEESLGGLIGKKASTGVMAGTKTGAALYGFETGLHKLNRGGGNVESDILQASEKIKPNYSNIDF